jgi:hypothetical protein
LAFGLSYENKWSPLLISALTKDLNAWPEISILTILYCKSLSLSVIYQACHLQDRPFYGFFWLFFHELYFAFPHWRISIGSSDYVLKVRLSQNEFMKSSILQNSNWKMWRISAQASKTRSNQKEVLIFLFLFIFLSMKVLLLFLNDLFLEARAGILQIFQLLFLVN